MFRNILKTTLNEIMGPFETPTSFEKFQNYLDEHGWPLSYPLPQFKKEINLILKEKLPEDFEGEMLDLLMGQTRSAIKLTKKQREELKKFKTIASAAKKQKCNHEKIGIAPFMHGGGFSPVFAQAEAICLNCAVNVTLYPPKDIKLFKTDLGVDTTKEKMVELRDWAQTCMKNSREDKRVIDFAEEITRDPITAYNKAGYKWEGEIPFTITDKKVFESNSGK